VRVIRQSPPEAFGTAIGRWLRSRIRRIQWQVLASVTVEVAPQ